MDLKLHDIPNTVMEAMSVLSGLDVDICNLHASGTKEMMEYAVKGLTRPDGSRPLLIAVTQLTSTSEENLHRELLIDRPLEEVVRKYALARQGSRVGRGGLFALGGRGGSRILRKEFLDRHPRHPFCRRREGRPETGDHSGRCPENGLGLHCGRPSRSRRRQTRWRPTCGA